MALSTHDLDVAGIKAGKRYRIVTVFQDGSTNTFEGVVHDVVNVPQRHALVHWTSGRDTSAGRAVVVGEIVEGVTDVRVTRLPDPLPTAPGTIIRHLVEQDRRTDRRVTLVNVGGRWVTVETGSQPRLVNDVDFEVLYEPTSGRVA